MGQNVMCDSEEKNELKVHEQMMLQNDANIFNDK